MLRSKGLRRALVRAAGLTSGRAFAASFAVEYAGSTLAYVRHFNVQAWGNLPSVESVQVSVPRSLRRYFGRYVEAIQ